MRSRNAISIAAGMGLVADALVLEPLPLVSKSEIFLKFAKPLPLSL